MGQALDVQGTQRGDRWRGRGVLLASALCVYGLGRFGKREGISPTFTSYKSWTGHSLESEGISEQRLVRKYLHGYGPASSRGFMGWLGVPRHRPNACGTPLLITSNRSR